MNIHSDQISENFNFNDDNTLNKDIQGLHCKPAGYMLFIEGINSSIQSILNKISSHHHMGYTPPHTIKTIRCQIFTLNVIRVDVLSIYLRSLTSSYILKFDDISCLAEKYKAQKSMKYLMDHARENNQRIIFTDRQPVDEIEGLLPDLRERLLGIDRLNIP